MEALLLLGSIVSTFISSSLLSISLVLRSLTINSSRSSSSLTAVQQYEGHVRHSRRRPVPHSFEYPVRYALIDLDLAPQPPHLSASEARRVADTDGPVFLLTIPASVGYEQNPLSVYYCYDGERVEGDGEEGSGIRLKMCIAEVTNTPWGEKVMFAFNPRSDVVAKPLHVSPFMDMMGNWTIHADAPAEDLYLSISIRHPKLGNYFCATLSASRVCSSSNPLSQEMFFWLMPHKVAMWIYWQALKLWWKKVAFIDHPRYSNSRYREDAVMRDQELCREVLTGDKSDRLDDKSCGNYKRRWCIWKEAKWPWS